MTQPAQLSERCAVCDCILHRSGGYASGTFESRSHATRHHLVAEPKGHISEVAEDGSVQLIEVA